MTPNRLLLLTQDFPPKKGGVARYLQLLVNHFAPRITIITTGLFFRFFWPKWFASVLLLIKQNAHYDIAITSHVLPIGTAMWVASWITKKPYAVIVHGFDVHLAASRPFKRLLAQQILAHARVVVANSEALAREVTIRFHIPLPIKVYPCIENVPRSHNDNNSEKSRYGRARGNNGDQSVVPEARPSQFLANSFQILTVGRLVRRKGHAQTLMVLSRLKQTGRMPEFQYIIAGDGPMRQTLENMAGQLHLDEVNFLGEVTDEVKNQLYAQADLFVMPVLDDPIDKEGFGLVFLEAALASVPSISTKIAGVDEAILDGKTGILVAPGNLEALASAIMQLATDRMYRKKLGAQAKERVETEFTCQQQFSKLEPYL
jgi:glycosyltransferase involved in cell wall biosynthesis